MRFVPDSAEMVRALLEAEDIAGRAEQAISSAHLLLAFFTFPNRAHKLLNERGIDEERVLGEIRVVEDEPPRTIVRIRDRAREIARSAGSRNVDCLHLLIALIRLRDAFAFKLLQRSGTSLTSLRNIALSYVTGHMPPRYRTLSAASPGAEPWLQRRNRLTPPIVTEPAPAKAGVEDTISGRQPDTEEEPLGEEDEFDVLSGAVDAAATVAKELEPRIEVEPSPTDRPVAPEDDSIEAIAPTLASCGVDLTEMARRAELDIAIGRDRELERLIDILGKRRANNPVLVGPPGVGKTAIVEGLAVRIARGDEEVEHFRDRIIFALDTGALVAGTSLRGAFSERIGAIKTEVAAAKGKIIVFIDELHTLIGAGTSGEGPQDAANELKSALARGEFPCIGATTHEEFKKHIEKDPALERRFDPIYIEEPSVDEAILILEGAISPYANYHQTTYSLDAVHAAVQLSHRFVPERKLPDKAFAVVDLAGSRAHRRGAANVTRFDIAQVINEWSGVPLERLAEADADRFNRAEEIIGAKLIGHDDILRTVCSAIRRGFAGFSGKRPIGSFLFLGPTGVGKTELVKVLAEFLFGNRDHVVRVDMSELAEKHSVARLIGAQPGYVGYEEGGQLTEALRKRPFQIVLFDEIEKAHRDVQNLLLQVLDEGHLTDARSRRVSFANTIIVLTSNLGSEAIQASGQAIGFGNAQGKPSSAEPVLAAAQAALLPELWGRIDERLVFAPLTRDQVRNIADLQLAESARVLFGEREITLQWNDEILGFLLDNGGFSSDTGARQMRSAIRHHIEEPVAAQILRGKLEPGDMVRISIANSKVVIAATTGMSR